MTNGAQLTQEQGFLAVLGYPHLLRTFRSAIWPPDKLLIALAGVILTVLWAGLLDWVAGNNVAQDAISNYVAEAQTDAAIEPVVGDRGVFEVFLDHQRQCAGGVLRSIFWGGADVSRPAAPSAAQATLVGNVASMVHGVRWLVSVHSLYSIFLGVGMLVIWSWAGGAICRMVAFQFARDDTIGWAAGLSYARKRFLTLVSAPLIPLVGVAFVALLLFVGGLVLWIPWIGDIIGGVLFFLALIGGFVATFALVGLVPAVSLSWPAVAVDDADSLEAIAGRGYAYFYQRPARTVLYGAVSFIVGSVCWVVLSLILSFALRVTHACVGAGTLWFGWASREHDGAGLNKLEAVWPIGGDAGLYAWPDANLLTGVAGSDYVSAFLVSVWVLLTIGLLWAFLASFYFTAATVTYFLLRRDIDGIDLEDLTVDEEEEPTEQEIKPSPDAPQDTGTIPLPTVEDESPTVEEDSPADEEESSAQEGKSPQAEGDSPDSNSAPKE